MRMLVSAKAFMLLRARIIILAFVLYEDLEPLFSQLAYA